MKRTHARKRPQKVAVALGAVLVTAGCASATTQNTSVPVEQSSRNDGGVEQLLLYCDKLQNSGELTTAASICERAHIIAPDDPQPLLKLGEIFTKMEALPQAVAAYQMILEKTPHHAEARYLLGKTYVAMGRNDLALQELQFALTQNPNDVRAYNALGIANSMLGNQDAARQAFESGLKITPTDIPLRNNLGLALVLGGSHAEGLAILQAAAADPTANATTIRNLRLAEKIAQSAEGGQDLAMAAPENTPAAPAGPAQIASAATETEFSAMTKPAAQTEPLLASPPSDTPPQSHAVPPSIPTEPVMLAGALQPLPNDSELSAGDMPVYLDSDPNSQAIEAAEMETDQTESAPTTDEFEDSASTEDGTKPSGGAMDTVATVTMPKPTLTAKTELPPGNEPAPTATLQAVVTASASMAPQPTIAPVTSQMANLNGELGDEESYSVQLAAFRSEDRAQDGWLQIRAKALDLLENIDPVIRRSDLGLDKGVYFRLRTKPSSKAAANQLCTALQSRGISCLTIKESPAAAENANTPTAAKS